MTAILRHPPLAALAVLAAFSWLRLAGQPELLPPRDVSVPASVGPWTGMPLAEIGRAPAIQEAGVALMEYRLGKEPPVWWSEVAGVGARSTYHPPELCLVGSHLEILEREPITVFANGEAHRVMRLVIGEQGRRYESWYWFTADDRVTPSYYQQQLWLALDSVRRESAFGSLVRISTPVAAGAETSRRRLLAFFTSLTAHRTPATPRTSPHGL